MVLDAAVQVEMDEELTLRALGDLDKQGTAESYFLNPSVQKMSLSSLNESFQNVAVNEALMSGLPGLSGHSVGTNSS